MNNDYEQLRVEAEVREDPENNTYVFTFTRGNVVGTLTIPGEMTTQDQTDADLITNNFDVLIDSALLEVERKFAGLAGEEAS